jgi:hypothetical protein
MFAASKSGSAAAPTDAQFNYVTMLLHGDGTNGAQNNTFLDSSTNNFTITRNGNTTQGTFTPYGSNWSNNLGSGNYVSAASNSAFALGTGDFTVEAWVYPTSAYTTYNYVLGVAVTNGLVFYVTGGNLVVRAYDTGDLLSSSTIPALNTWTHVAATRSGTTLRIFVNGVQTASTTNSTNFAQGSAVVGNDGTNAAPWYGYISNLRLVKGTAVYTSAFTPSTTPLTAVSGTSLLTCQSNRFIDNSSNAFALTVTGSPSVQRFSPFSPTSAYSTSVIGGSGYFDGSGDYLSAPNNSAFNLASNSFTIEAFYYTSSTSDQVIISAWNTNSFEIIYSGGTLYLQANASTPRLTTTTWPLNQWNHVVFVRSGNTYSGYLNGVRFATTTDTQSISNINAGPTIGVRQGGTSFPFNGYLSNLRVVNGTAVYDPTVSTLTVPTAPLTAITNTSLLLNYTNAGILDNAMMNDLETVGNAQISTSVKKYGTGSISFDGTDDRLTTASSPNIAFGTGDFTVEAWVYTNVLVGERGFIQTSATVGGLQTSYTNGVISTVAAGAGSYTFNCNIAGTNIGGSVPVTTGTWYHVAFTRSSGSVRLFINGTLAGGPTTITANLDGQNICVGGYYNNSYLWNGYVDDLRITKGVARYTTTFTPPTAAFPDKG